MKNNIAIKLIATCAILTGAEGSFAHVILQDGAAAAGVSYRATLRVGHACGTSPTTAMWVTIPAGFNGAQPMPKAGWALSTKVGKLAQPYESHGTTPTTPGPLWFKVLQSCAQGANDWSEVPASGTSTKGLKSPAVLLEVLDIQAAGGHAH